MKNAGTYEVSECIYHSESSIIFKALNIKNNEKVIIKTLNEKLYDSMSLSKLKNEYKILRKLASEYVVNVYDFLKEKEGFYIVIEDFGGIALSEYIKTQQVTVQEFMDIALQITMGLDYIHKNAIVHKDINPSNIVYNPDKKIIKIIDFGISSEFEFEIQQGLNPNRLEGTMDYISPEQTGRMNRTIDYRTDFYSLGVTLYELICGKLPFVSEDPAELVYFHMAKTPLSVSEVNPMIPEMISRIISKLMAKMPEERYKNAAGIIFDLEKCIEMLKTNEIIEEFELGMGDILDKFEIPKKLYGRDEEIKKLLSFFENTSKEKSGIVLIGGYSGIGKTSLVNEIHSPIMKEHGMFVSGKFDQFHRNIPFSAFLQAIDQFCNYILSEPERKIAEWKKKIIEALASKGRLITEIVPRLELIIGEQPVLQEVSSIEEQERFKVAIQNLIMAISSPQHPLVLFMDDVHWADMGSLETFEEILTNDDINGLMLICTYRDNEVDASHPLMGTIEKIKKNSGKIEYIKLKNLHVQMVEEIISDILNCKVEDITQLTKVVYEKTFGNPFYTIEFLKHCNEENLIYYEQSERKWKWNELGIQSSEIEDNVVDFLIKKMYTLPKSTQEIISIAACIEDSFDMKMLSNISMKDSSDIMQELKPAIFAEMIYPFGKNSSNLEEMQFHFCHDRFKQAGYMILSEDAKKRIHLNIARYYEEIQQMKGDSYLFKIAEHYSKAIDLLLSKEEIKRVIEIFLKAAHAARISSAFDTARQYLELVMNIAPEFLKEDTMFMFSLYSQYHMILFSLARLDEADDIYTRLVNISKEPLQLADSCCLQLVSLSNRSKYEEAFMLGVSLLEKLGVEYPKDNIINVIQEEIDKYYEFKRNGILEKLKDKEIQHMPKEKAIARLLNRIVAAGFFYSPLNSFWAIIINVNRMIEKGITSEALQAYADLILLLIPFRNDFYTGYISAKKALELAEKKGLTDDLYRIYHVYSLFSIHWFEGLEKGIEYAHKAYKGNVEIGEFEFASFSFYTSQVAILECCNSIAEVEYEVEADMIFSNKMGNIHALGSTVSFRQLIKALKGETLSYGSFNDESFNEEKHMEGLQCNISGLCNYYIYRALSAVFFGDFKTAFANTEKTVPIIPYITGFYPVALHNFLHSLSICKTIEQMEDSEEKTILQNKLKENQIWLYQRAKDAPFNFQHLYDLIDAETKIQEQKYGEAFALYEKAILGAETNKRTYHYALACELTGIQYLKMDINRIGTLYLKEAYSTFLSWEAKGKTEEMKQKYKYILFSGIDNVSYLKSSLRNTTVTKSTTATEFIDLNAIMKAAQTISGEIKLQELLQKLVYILLENAGAQKIYYLIKEEDQYIIQAEGWTEEKKIEIMQGRVADAESLPEKIIYYVEHSKESVILDKAFDSEKYKNDPYILANQSKSIMCMPVLSKGEIIGILYLENNLVEGAFNSQCIEILKIIASQLAISMENANLYNNLKRSEEKYRKLVENIHDGVCIIQDEAIQFANEAFAKIMNYSIEETIGSRFYQFIVPEDRKKMANYYKQKQDGKNILGEYEVQVLQKNQTDRRTVIVKASIIIFNERKATLLTLKDITERKVMEEELRRHHDHLEELVEERTHELKKEISERKKAQKLLEEIATHDYLTGLPNRKFFIERLEHALELAKRNKLILGILFIDLDGFKSINDKFGHDSGDIVLKSVADRLLKSVRNCDTVSRLGGDEFTIIMENVEDISAIRRTCQKIIDAVGKTIILGEDEGRVTASIGVSIFPHDSRDLDMLVNKADDAMYIAKKSGKNKFVFSSNG